LPIEVISIVDAMIEGRHSNYSASIVAGKLQV